MLNLKKLLTKILTALPTYRIAINGRAFQGTTSNAWEYVDGTFTVEAGHWAIALCTQGYTSGRPIGIGLGTSTSQNPPLNTQNSASSSETLYRGTFLLPAGTYYLYTKRATVPSMTNSYSVHLIDFNFN